MEGDIIKGITIRIRMQRQTQHTLQTVLTNF